MTTTNPSSIQPRKGDEVSGREQALTLSDLLADDVRDYFLRESMDGLQFESSGNGVHKIPQSRDEGHPFRYVGRKDSKFAVPYSYLSASSESYVESMDSGDVAMSSSSSSSLFQRVSKTMTSDTFNSAGGSSCSSSPSNPYHAQHAPNRFQNQENRYSSDECSENNQLSSHDDTNQYYDCSSEDASDASFNSEQPLDNDRTNHDQSFLYHNVEFGEKLVRFHHALELKNENDFNHCTEYDRLLGKNNNNGGGSYNSCLNASLPSKRTTVNITNGSQRLGGPGSLPLRLDDAFEVIQRKMKTMLLKLELFISNMPSLVGSLALAWCSIGVDWFKWYEITFDTCYSTNYHSKLCTYTEFPGCFVCETERRGYQLFLQLHYLCSTVALVLSSFLIGKVLIAFPVVRDELANPTTAAPLGLLCMAFEKVFAGNFGFVGEGITFVAAGLQTIVGCWFIFISVAYKTLPEPSWFPNTTGIGLAAVKMYLYWSIGAYFLSGFSLVAFSMFYVVALYRIHTNEKISLPVCWVQLSGPAVVMYGFTIFSQPKNFNDDAKLLIPENKEHFVRVHTEYYMPVMHVLFAFCAVSMISSLYLLKTRWKTFREKEFSPAHISLCAPLASHANGIQSYISSLNQFSSFRYECLFMSLLYNYWTCCLVCGTVLILVMSVEFVRHLSTWCHLDVDDDETPPEPGKTIVSELMKRGDARDSMTQSFVSAAVLQANETGALVRVLRDGKMKYVRSRRTSSMGFDPIMNASELLSERELLLQRISHSSIPSRDRGGISSFNGTPTSLNEVSRQSRHRFSLDNI